MVKIPERAFQVGFLLLDGFALMSYSAASEPLRAANLLAGKQLYKVRNIPVWGAQSESSGGAVVKASAQIGEQIDFDLVLVVADGNPADFNDKRVLQWLRHLSHRGVLLGGVSGGPVILAKAGLLQGRRVTVRRDLAAALAEISPLSVVERSLFVIDRDRYSCAGGTAPMDMMHALLSQRHGSEFAKQVSDYFLHTEVRQSDTPRRSGLVERFGTTNGPVILALEAMENHISDVLDLGQLAKISGVSPRQLNRLFGAKLGQGTMQVYRDMRLDKASQLISHSAMLISQIAFATGFCNPAHFSKIFHAKFGASPSNLRK